MTQFVKLLLSSMILIIGMMPASAQTGCFQTRTYYFPDPAGGPPFRPLLAEGGQTDSPLFRTDGPVN